jgi:hypothetical protein
VRAYGAFVTQVVIPIDIFVPSFNGLFVGHHCVFRLKPITDSGASRSPSPAEADH